MIANTNIDKIFDHLWNEIREDIPGEPNIHDFRLMAQVLRLHYLDEMLQDLPNCEIGLNIVDYIEDNIFKDAATYKIDHKIRKLSREDFFGRMKQAARDLQFKGYLHGGVAKILSAAFYTWYSCLRMAKLTRTEDILGIQYTNEMRYSDYEDLRNEWEDAVKFGNPWIKFGVKIAKLLEEKRKKANPKKIIVDDWVPPNSPYWECFKKS